MNIQHWINVGQVTHAPDLTPEERAVERRFMLQIKNNIPAAVEEYRKRFGNRLSADDARYLSYDYSASKEAKTKWGDAVHEPASFLVKQVYKDMLKEPDPHGLDLVIITGGGAAAGKTLGATKLPSLSSLTDHAQIIYNTTLQDYESGKSKIDQALKAGKKVIVAFFWREPVEAFVNGALPRAEATGRAVSVRVHRETHEGSAGAIRRLQESYKDDHRVKFVFIDNSKGEGEAATVEFNPVFPSYGSDLSEKLNEALEHEYEHKRISKPTYDHAKQRK